MSISDIDNRGPGRIWLKFAIDLAIWNLAALLAFPLRHRQPLLCSARLLPAVHVRSGSQCEHRDLVGRPPRQAWRQSTVDDLVHLLAAVAGGTAVMFVVGLLLYEGSGFPRTAPLSPARWR